MTRQLYENEVLRTLLALREALVRHDENWKAWQLLAPEPDGCVPYFLEQHPDLVEARREQREMVLHMLDPKAYRAYYGDNPNEAPFEQMYGIEPEQAHAHIPRVGFLRDGLARQMQRRGLAAGEMRVLDLAANDGWMAVNLWTAGLACDCVDLGKDTCARARRRLKKAKAPGSVSRARAEDVYPQIPGGPALEPGYDAVAVFEVIEHVHKPRQLLLVARAMVPPGGEVYVSTPDGAVELGEIPEWDKVERKGHVRVYTAATFRAELQAAGLKVEQLVRGADGVLLARTRPKEVPSGT